MNEPKDFRIGAPLSGEPHPSLQWIEVAEPLQIPGFQIIGLPAPEVAEARERVRAAIEASGLPFPRRRVILNLSPASVRKHGTGADLAMALAVLHESYADAAGAPAPATVVAWGELGLDGKIKGAGQVTRAVFAAWEGGAELLLVSREEHAFARERLELLRTSRMIPQHPPPRILGLSRLRDAWEGLKNPLKAPPESAPARACPEKPMDGSALLRLPRTMERLLGIAAAGAHHLILLGPRGTGKSHALEWLIALQPRTSPEVRIQRALLAELAGLPAASEEEAPARRISAQIRPAALLGAVQPGGVRPGEFSLAHGGLLLADELPEWPRDSRETLREPLERGLVTLTRARQSVELPAQFVLAANGNLCPCGGWPHELPIPVEANARRITRCRCPPSSRGRYLARLSGPILDRLDLVIIAAYPGLPQNGQDSTACARLTQLRDQVRAARERSISQWGAPAALLSSTRLEQLIGDHPLFARSLHPARFASLRTRHKILRVALTLAAWDGEASPSNAHFSEAACYRPERFGLV